MCLFHTAAHAQPSLENSLTLPAIVNGSTTTASDGYGLHFVKLENDGSIKHYLVGNDGIELTNYRGTVSSTGTFPILNAYQGKLRVVFNIGTEMKVYQSTDGGVNWYQINAQFIFGEGSIYNIDAVTDFYGTHIVWQDREDFTNNPRVFYRRWDDNIQQWANYKNVSDLSGSPWHRKPKISTSASEAHVGFLDYARLTTRDLNLSNGLWDGSYAAASGNNAIGEAVSVATIGSKLYAIIYGLPLAQQNPPEPAQYIFFAYRDINGLSWQVDPSPLTSSRIAFDYNRKNLVAATVSGTPKLFFLNTCFVDTRLFSSRWGRPALDLHRRFTMDI